MYWLNFLKYMFFSDSLMLFECFEFNKDVPITVLGGGGGGGKSFLSLREFIWNEWFIFNFIDIYNN